MSTALQELTSFHQFALDSLRSRDEDVSLEQLLETWRAQKEREEVNAGIRRGLAEMEAGKGIPLDDFLAEFDKKHGLKP
jgi:predicted transcriptional regulator